MSQDFYERLWIKAKLFTNRAMDDDIERSFDERALWASLALELLAKSALARTSPVLVADPVLQEGKQLLAAVGLIDSEAEFQTVKASTVFKRCALAFRPFSEKKAQQIANARNDYLHAGAVGFLKIPRERWWGDFWRQAHILILAQDKTIEDLVGNSRGESVRNHIESDKEYTKETVQVLISSAKSRYRDSSSGDITKKRLQGWRTAVQLSLGYKYKAEEICPACGQVGYLEADEVDNIRVEDGEWVRHSDGGHEYYGRAVGDALAEFFYCVSCQLVLDGWEFLEASGLGTTFEVESDDFLSELHEAEYGND